MTTKTIKTLQKKALFLSAICVILCFLFAAKPEWMGVTGLEESRVISIAPLVCGVGFAGVGCFYFIMLSHIKTENGIRAVVIVSSILLCVFSVIVEPVVYAWESRQFQFQVLQIKDAAKGITMISARQAVREAIRLILFVSGALSFLSMGGIWGKMSK